MTDTFRKEYKPLSAEQLALMERVKVYAEDLLRVLSQAEDSREKSLAITKLEECVMWSIKGIT